MNDEIKKKILLVALGDKLMVLGISTQHPLLSLISYVVVDERDSAFQSPSKPIGPVFTEEKAVTLPYPTRKTEKGCQCVVSSPKPLTWP